MLTDQEIEDLIKSPKIIKERVPAKEYRQESGHQRCDLKLESTLEKEKMFSMFIRQNSTYMENFSIGLRYKTTDKALGSVTLVRYNGPHGETSRGQDGHYNQSHIHRITATEMASGSTEPQEKNREITDRYGTLEEAIRVFCVDVGIANYSEHFPGLDQPRLSNGN